MPISELRFKQILRIAAGCLAAASLGIGAWAVWPIDSNSDSLFSVASFTAKKKFPKTQTLDDVRDPNAFSSLWSRSLQGRSGQATLAAPVSKPKPMTTAKPVIRSASATSVETGIRLVGTVIEQGRGIAIASDRSGNVVFHQAGEQLQLEPSGVLIQSVATDSVWVQFQGQQTELKVGQALRQQKQTSGHTAKASTNVPERNKDDSEELAPLDSEERTPLRTEDFPKMSLEDELDSLNGD